MYNKNENKKSNEAKISALPTIPATTSVWIGWTVNIIEHKRAVSSSLFLLLKSNLYTGNVVTHSITYKNTFVAWKYNSFSSELANKTFNLKIQQLTNSLQNRVKSPYLYVSIAKGRYDLWLIFNEISVPQKSFLNMLRIGVDGKTSLFLTTASVSSNTNVPNKVFT